MESLERVESFSLTAVVVVQYHFGVDDPPSSEAVVLRDGSRSQSVEKGIRVGRGVVLLRFQEVERAETERAMEKEGQRSAHFPHSRSAGSLMHPSDQASSIEDVPFRPCLLWLVDVHTSPESEDESRVVLVRSDRGGSRRRRLVVRRRRARRLNGVDEALVGGSGYGVTCERVWGRFGSVEVHGKGRLRRRKEVERGERERERKCRGSGKTSKITRSAGSCTRSVNIRSE